MPTPKPPRISYHRHIEIAIQILVHIRPLPNPPYRGPQYRPREPRIRMDDQMDATRARHDGVFVDAGVGRREAGAGDDVEGGGQETGEDVLALEGARVVGEGYHLKGSGHSVDEGVGGEGAGLW